MTQTYSLFVDTTQNLCNIAILKDNKMQSFLSIPTHNNMTDLVVEYVKQELEKSNVKLNKIAKLYLLIGPGSFTGCRVGYLVIKTFANILNLPVYYLDSLIFQTKNGTGISIIDAKSNKKYLAIYQDYKAIVKPQIINADEVENTISQYPNLTKYEDYNNVNIKQNLLTHLNHFLKCEDIDKLAPLYLKEPI